LLSPLNTAYSSLLLIAGAICILVAVIILQSRRAAAGASTLTLLLFALAWWDITYAIFWAGAPGPTKYFWLDITYLGTVMVPPSLFIFTLQLTNKGNWLQRPLILFMYLEPILVLACLFTDPYHGLFFAGKRAENSAVILNAGPVFWFNVAYSYALTLLSTILIVQGFHRSSGIYRKQFGIILAGIAVTWLNSIIFVAGLNPLPGADNTPFSFTIAAVAFAFGIGRYHLLDIIPVARDSLIEKMADGILVIDSRNRIVDMNPAAQVLLNINKDALGSPVEEAIRKWPQYQKDSSNFKKEQIEIELGRKSKKYVDMQVTPITDGKGKGLGRLIILHDITKLKQIQSELHLLVNNDSLTGAISRGHFMDLAGREIQRTMRYKRKLSLVLMDMDAFKNINDSYGHAAGDQALIMLTRICTRGSRKVDIFARLGGEEFALLLPETPQQTAADLAERLRALVETTSLRSDSAKFNVTASMGVAEFGSRENDSLDRLLHRADKALYAAKAGGRNRVVIWKPEME
jgi:diguanylate cyclase (GGDEF)-like protein/PAS domain S-box-containing protein